MHHLRLVTTAAIVLMTATACGSDAALGNLQHKDSTSDTGRPAANVPCPFPGEWVFVEAECAGGPFEWGEARWRPELHVHANCSASFSTERDGLTVESVRFTQTVVEREDGADDPYTYKRNVDDLELRGFMQDTDDCPRELLTRWQR